MHFLLWVSGAMMLGATAAAETPAAEPAIDEAPPPPPMPPLPTSHHDRPLPLGVTYSGVLGELLYGGKLDEISRNDAAWQARADHSGCASS